jgi:hypothetical protein
MKIPQYEDIKNYKRMSEKSGLSYNTIKFFFEGGNATKNTINTLCDLLCVNYEYLVNNKKKSRKDVLLECRYKVFLREK